MDVNSVKQRAPRLLPWLDQRQTHRNGVAILSRPVLEACWPVSPGRLAQLQAVGDYRAGMFHKDPLGHGE